MALTPAQVETVREVALLNSIAETQSYLNTLSAVQETAIVDLIENEWPAVRFRVGHLVPNSKDLINSQIEKRRLIRHTLRIMLGLEPVSDYEIDMAELDGSYGNVIGGLGKGGSGAGGGGRGEFGVFSTSGYSRRSNRTDGELS